MVMVLLSYHIIHQSFTLVTLILLVTINKLRRLLLEIFMMNQPMVAIFPWIGMVARLQIFFQDILIKEWVIHGEMMEVLIIQGN